MKKRIVLIQPGSGSCYMERYRDKPALPLGLLAAAAIVCREFAVEIVDQRLCGEMEAELDRHIRGETLLFGFSAYTGPMITEALRMCRYIKERSDIPVVWGGHHASLLPRQTLEHPDIDFVIQGEGEYPLLELAEVLAAGSSDFSGIAGLHFKQHGEVQSNPSGELLMLDELPPIPYWLIQVEDYLQYYRGRRFLYYQMSRGCPQRCTYCFNVRFNKGRFRFKSVETIIGEIDDLRARYDFDGIYFTDDNLFCLAKKTVFRLADAFEERGLQWYVQGADIVSLGRYDRQEFLRLYRTGLLRLTIGIESGSPAIRRLMGKKGDLAAIRRVFWELRDVPIIVNCNYMINLPSETIDDLRQSVDLIFELKRINKNVRNDPFYKFVAYYGTVIAEQFPDLIRFPHTLADWGAMSWEGAEVPTYPEYLEDEDFFQGLFLASLLADAKVADFSQHRLLELISRLYRPIASFRLRHLFFKLNPELYLFRKIFRDFFEQGGAPAASELSG